MINKNVNQIFIFLTLCTFCDYFNFIVMIEVNTNKRYLCVKVVDIGLCHHKIVHYWKLHFEVHCFYVEVASPDK